MFLPLAPSLFFTSCSSTPISGEEERDNLQLAGCCGRKLAFSGLGRKAEKEKHLFCPQVLSRNALLCFRLPLLCPFKKGAPFFLFSRYDAQQCCKKRWAKVRRSSSQKEILQHAHIVLLWREKNGRGKSGGRWINLVFSSPSMGQKKVSRGGGKGRRKEGLSFPSLSPSTFSQSFFFPSFLLFSLSLLFSGGEKREKRSSTVTLLYSSVGQGEEERERRGGSTGEADLDNVTLAIVRDSFIYLPPYRSTMFLSPFSLFTVCDPEWE